MLLPASWLAIAAIFLVGFRVGLNVTNSNVIDVGYAGVIGADKLLHGKNLYGHWPSDNAYGDTYGPVAYYAYVPFRAIFGWSGHWDSLPAAHAAAIAFDLLMLIGLFFLGRMVRGPTLGILLAYLWAAYPFTLWTMNSNTNDTLVGLLVVGSLLFIRWAPARGGLAALAGLTKFAPFALGPLLLRGLGGWRPVRSIVLYVLAYAGDPGPQPVEVLARHVRVSVPPSRAVLDLGPVERIERRAASGGGGDGRARDRGGVRAPPARLGRDFGARRGGVDRAPAERHLLAVLLHRVVLPAGHRGAVRSLPTGPPPRR
jgi:hypothetical protein